MTGQQSIREPWKRNMMARIGTDSMIRVKVCDTAACVFYRYRELLVHEHLIKADSKCMQREIDSIRNDVVELSLWDRSWTFIVYKYWLYSGRLCTLLAPIPTKQPDYAEESEEEREYNVLQRLYSLGRLLDSQNFQEAVVKAFIEKLQERSPPVLPGVWYIKKCQESMPDSGLYKLIVKAYAAACEPDKFEALQLNLPTGFISAVYAELFVLSREEPDRLQTLSLAEFIGYADEDDVSGSDAEEGPTKRRRLSSDLY